MGTAVVIFHRYYATHSFLLNDKFVSWRGGRLGLYLCPFARVHRCTSSSCKPAELVHASTRVPTSSPTPQSPRQLIAMACLYLGGKLEDTPKSARDVITACCMRRYGPEVAGLSLRNHVSL